MHLEVLKVAQADANQAKRWCGLMADTF